MTTASVVLSWLDIDAKTAQDIETSASKDTDVPFTLSTASSFKAPYPTGVILKASRASAKRGVAGVRFAGKLSHLPVTQALQEPPSERFLYPVCDFATFGKGTTALSRTQS